MEDTMIAPPNPRPLPPRPGGLPSPRHSPVNKPSSPCSSLAVLIDTVYRLT